MNTTMTPHTHRPPASRRGTNPLQRQAGVATLVVVLLLFFIMSLVAAYASRNLIFEARTSANQYRSTQSHEATEAGLEWATAMLNGGRIGDDCLPTVDTTRNAFRQRYLNTDTATGVILPQPNASNPANRLWTACSFDGANWTCRCPTGALAATDLPAGRSAFAVRFVQQTSKPGHVRVEVNGCNSYDLTCLQAEISTFSPFVCRSSACAMLALSSGAKASPTAAVVARLGVDGSALSVVNQHEGAAGITVHSGGSVSVASLALASLPGTPPQQSLRANDSILAAVPDDSADCDLCTFATTFGVRPATYRRQMGTLNLNCATPCSAADVNSLLASARGRVVYVSGVGGLTIDDPAAAIGAATDPVVLVVDGPLVVTSTASTGARIHGLVYANSASLSGGEIRGSLVTPGSVTGAGPAKVVYDGAALARLRLTSGTFARVPGSWRDFP